MQQASPMILYTEDSSPWCAPVRAAIYAKGLEIAMASPPGGMRSEEYRALSGAGTLSGSFSVPLCGAVPSTACAP